MAVEPGQSGVKTKWATTTTSDRMQKGPTSGTPEALAEAQMTSAAAFVEGGVQDPCDDACSICLESFNDSNPASVTVCKHEYHLQCILEWAQRSKLCPMCWQTLCLKDQDSQSLLAAAEEEKVLRQHTSPFFHNSSFDTEFHRFGLTFSEDSDLEDRILHRLAAATMARAHHVTGRGESLRFRPSPGQGHSHRRVVPVHFNASSPQMSTPVASSSPGSLLMQPSPSSTGDVVVGSSGVSSIAQVAPLESSTSGSLTSDTSEEGSSSMEACSSGRQASADHVESSQGGGGGGAMSPELSNSESFKNRLAAASSKYRESLKRTTRGLRERLRGRNGTPEELGSPTP